MLLSRSIITSILLCFSAFAASEESQVSPLSEGGVYNGFPIGNPYRSYLPAGAQPNYEYWNTQSRPKPEARQFSARSSSSSYEVSTLTLIEESEHSDIAENNDSLASAMDLNDFVYQKFAIVGRLTTPSLVSSSINTEQLEDNDTPDMATSISMATPNTEVVSNGILGDGSNQSSDFDIFHITDLNTQKPLTLLYQQDDTERSDRVRFSVFDKEFELLGRNYGYGNASLSTPLLEEHDELYVAVGDNYILDKEALLNPGQRYGYIYTEIPYSLTFLQPDTDTDYFSFTVDAGQTISLSTSNPLSNIALYYDGEEIISGFVPGFNTYPENSPLNKTNYNHLTYEAVESGTYSLKVSPWERQDQAIDYQVNVDIIDHAKYSLADGGHQVVFLDFDGATLNGQPFNGISKEVSLSPFADFLQKFGLELANENALIEAISTRFKQKIEQALPEYQANGDSKITVLNSLSDDDIFGDKNVSRIIIGGSIAELQLSTIGIAESIDPGNQVKEETAIVLLDTLSDPYSYDGLARINNSTSQFELVADTIATIAAHEMGHLLSAFHTDHSNDVVNIMDQGGDLNNTIGLGEDGIYGTEDDINVTFQEDEFSFWESLNGSQDTKALIISALKSGQPSVKAPARVDPNQKSDDDEFLGIASLNHYLMLLLTLILAIRVRKTA